EISVAACRADSLFDTRAEIGCRGRHSQRQSHDGFTVDTHSFKLFLVSAGQWTSRLQVPESSQIFVQRRTDSSFLEQLQRRTEFVSAPLLVVESRVGAGAKIEQCSQHAEFVLREWFRVAKSVQRVESHDAQDS